MVIASHNAGGVIDACLRALFGQRGSDRIEVIVVDSSVDGTDRLVSSGTPQATLLHSDKPLTVPELRGQGIALARAPVIAILDPYSIAAPDWVEQTIAAHRRHANAVIGGSVALHREPQAGLAAWTLYFNEYGMFMPPVAAGAATIVPGSNVSYKRAALFDGERQRYPVFWKTFANWDAEAGGSPLWLEPAIRVELNKPIPLGDYFVTRFQHGRCFAAMRVQAAPWPVRLYRALTTPLVPFVLCARWSKVIWAKRRRRGIYLRTLPMQLALFSMWAAGELVGYLFGSGRSCRCLFY